MVKKRTYQNHIKDENILNQLIDGAMKRYAYFNVLKMDASHNPLARQALETGRTNISTAMELIQSDTIKTENNQQINRMTQAMQFLLNAAQFEQKKEIAFFNHYKDKIPKQILNACGNIESNNFDYINFIAAINSAVDTCNDFQKILNTEIKRINEKNTMIKQLNKINDPQEREQKITEYHSRHNRENYYLQYNSTTTFNTLISDKANLHLFTSIILQEAGASIFTFKRQLQLDNRRFTVLLKLLIDKCVQLLAAKISDDFTVNTLTSKKNEQIMREIAKENIQTILNAFEDNPSFLNALDSVADQMNVGKIESRNISDYYNKQLQLKQHLEKVYLSDVKEGAKTGISFSDYLKKNDINFNEIITTIDSVSAQGYYTGEDLSLVNLLLADISAVLGGRKNPTDDIQAGKLIVNFEYNPSEMKKLQKKLDDIQNDYFREQVSAISDLQSFRENTEALKNAREEQRQAIEKAMKFFTKEQQELAELVKHFNIHETIKGYFSAGSNDSYFKSEGGFAGASFGSNLINEINIVNEVITKAGLENFSSNDIEYLIIAAMNAGTNLIGFSNKKTLEQYFAAFAGLLMFNDAALMAEDIKNMPEHLETSTVTDIHLYELNGIKVPTSYVLFKTYEALTPIFHDSINQAAEESIHVELHTYNKTYQRGSTIEDMSSIVLDSTKFDMHFLAGFLGILEQIQLAMNNIK